MVSKSVNRVRRQRNNATSVRQVVKSMLRARMDLKKYSLVTASTTWATAGLIVPLSQGLLASSNINGRDGEAINPINLNVNFTLSSTTSAYLGRVIIFQDMLNVGVAPTVAQVLDGAVYDSTYTLYNTVQRRFRILHDKTYSTNNSTSITTDSGKIFDRIVLKMRGVIHYNGETDATASNGPGSLWILTIADVNAVGAYTYYSSIEYFDV